MYRTVRYASESIINLVPVALLLQSCGGKVMDGVHVIFGAGIRAAETFRRIETGR